MAPSALAVQAAMDRGESIPLSGGPGRDALARGNWRLALDLLDRFLVASPLGREAERAELDRARVLASAGDRAGAIGALRAFLGQWPGADAVRPATFTLASLLISLGHHQEAVSVLKQFQTQWPDEHVEQVAYALGWSYQALRQYAESERAFRYGLERVPHGTHAVQARMGLADTYWLWGRILAAAQSYSAVGRHLQDQDLRDRGSYLAGEAYSRQANWAAAIGQFRQVATERAWGPRAQYALAFAYLQAQQAPEAAQTIKAWLQRHPRHAWRAAAAYLGGLATLHAGDVTGAAGLFALSVQTDKDGPWSANALYGQAQAEYRLAKYAEAADHAAEVEQRFPKAPIAAAAKELLGEALYQQGHFDAAIRSLAHPDVSGSGKRALGFAYYRSGEYQAAIQAWSGFEDAEVRFYRAQAHLSAGQHDEAAKGFSTFLQANPHSNRVQEALYGLGSSLARAGKYEAAISPLSEAENAARPEIARAASLLLADCLVALQRHSAAREALGRFAASSPDAAGDTAYKVGWIWLQEGNSAKALEAWGAFRLSYPRHRRVPDALHQEGEILLKSKSFREAISRLSAAVAHPGSRPDLRAQALLGQAAATIGSGDNASAAQIYDQVRQSYPNFRDEASRGWLKALSDSSHLDEALKAVRDFLTAEPQKAIGHEAADHLGQRLVSNGRYNEAIDLLSGHPRPSAASLYWLGRAQRGAGRFDQAAATWQRLLEARDGYEHAALDQLGQMAYVAKDYAKATAYWQQLLDREPAASQPLKVQTRFNLALALTFAGHPEKTEAALKEMAADAGLKPEQRLEALRRLGNWLRERKRLQDAGKVYEQLAKQAPRPSLLASEALYWVGHSLIGAGAKADGLKALDRVGPVTPASDQRWWIQALFKQGELYEETGKWRLAMTAYQRILSLKAEESWRQDAEARVRWIRQHVPAKELR